MGLPEMKEEAGVGWKLENHLRRDKFTKFFLTGQGKATRNLHQKLGIAGEKERRIRKIIWKMWKYLISQCLSLAVHWAVVTCLKGQKWNHFRHKHVEMSDPKEFLVKSPFPTSLLCATLSICLLQVILFSSCSALF